MFEFRKDFTTVVLTHFLIEDYQILQNAYRTGNWEDVQIVMDNIATVIDQSTPSPAGPGPKSQGKREFRHPSQPPGGHPYQEWAGHYVYQWPAGFRGYGGWGMPV